MPRFTAFGRRKSTADNLNSAVVQSSFRVLERSEVNGKKLDGGGRSSSRTHLQPTRASNLTGEDNIFAGLKLNRGSGSSNTTKGTSTENSSRHSISTAASSTSEAVCHDDPRNQNQKPYIDIPIPPTPKPQSGFLKAASRRFSFGGQKKPSPPNPPVSQPASPTKSERCSPQQTPKRVRPATSSATTQISANLDDMGPEKRASFMALKAEAERQNLGPRSLTGGGRTTPSPLQLDKTTKIEPASWSWGSQHSADRLMKNSSPVHNESVSLLPPRHGSPRNGRGVETPSPDYNVKSPMLSRKPSSDEENTDDEEARLLRDSLAAVSQFVSTTPSPTKESADLRYRTTEVVRGFREPSGHSMTSQMTGHGSEDEGLFDRKPSYSARAADGYESNIQPSPPLRNKVMTPAQFEKYRRDKERDNRDGLDDRSDTVRPDDDVEEMSYEDDEDDLEKAKQQAKQRQKQEAQMAVYRQQMTKVTGETTNVSLHRSRPSLQMTMSTPDLPNLSPSPPSDKSDEDEEVPLAILAAHGFPNKNRPPTRLSAMMSNPNLRSASQVSYQRPGSVLATGGPGGALPAFARKLPQDPFVGAGLVQNQVRESLALSGGSPVTSQLNNSLPPGGLIGVIASEERSRAARRGSPRIEQQRGGTALPSAAPIDPVTGMPAHLMYPDRTCTPAPGDQAQLQMNHQMQQFLHMQMQFMQMMAGQNGPAPRPSSPHMHSASMGNVPIMNGFPAGLGGMPRPQGAPDMMRYSFVGNESMADLSRPPNMQTRTMSMVQPSSASWVQPPPDASYVPSMNMQGNAYAPSIAPSERSNIGLPGRYRPVSMLPTPAPPGRSVSFMPRALGRYPENKASLSIVKEPGHGVEDEDDEQGWQAMKKKRESKMSLRKTEKTLSTGISALIGRE